ncbi:MAG: hypothetical protein AB7F75_02660 [Planctomycetota bacterium]
MRLKTVGMAAFGLACLWALARMVMPEPDPQPREPVPVVVDKGDFDAFPTRRSLFQFGALMRAVLTGEPYVEADLGKPMIRQRAVIAVVSLRFRGQSDRWVLAAPSPDELLRRVEALSQRPVIKEALDRGGRVWVDLAVRMHPMQTAPLDRSVLVDVREGLTLGEEVFEPRRLMETGCLSQSGEVRAEALAVAFPDGDERRTALLLGKNLPWGRLGFRSLWIDDQGVHFDDEPQMLDPAHLDAAVGKILSWLGWVADDGFSVVRVDPVEDGTIRSVNTELDLLRLQAAVASSPFAARLPALRETVKARQVSANGRVYVGEATPADLQVRALALGLIPEVPSEMLAEASVVPLLTLAFARQDRKLIPDFEVSSLDLGDPGVQDQFPRLLWAAPPGLDDVMSLGRIRLIRRQRVLTDATDRLLGQLECLRLIDKRTFEEEAFLVTGTRELMSRVLHGGESSANPAWRVGGVRSGRQAASLDPIRALRTAEFLSWMARELEREPLPEVEGLVWSGESTASAIVHEGGMRLTVNLDPAKAAQVKGVSAHAQPRWRDSPSWVSCDAAVLAEASVPDQPNVQPIRKPEWLSRGVQVESAEGTLRVRVLTRHGELWLVAGQPSGETAPTPWTRVLDLENPASLLDLFIEHAWGGKHLALKLP